ncbi:ribosomal protein S3 [Thermoanaerobacter mathranii subsp. mathranii str. A3]|uniref:Small ribosomal subunit protein uS3 n=2 Tax=Thermoanaerobacter TaxID=1754 RepID=A0ABT9M3V0_9THEO|nr:MULTISPECIES: 30S ribosomal protein S3 [Thermoanaerobacter]ADH61614.1 ribosomal protein S3 [Thermoanaerobacter mathranii subsp. mathranii str. A3]MBT1278343.1 30S ribosomal protein S3 [Thermoanaerobacter sp. CM-CNRG TB177]MDP9750804.1 small subunit ribosomal protein S3 [Thermoanaerobacter pentosaceus]
MGQKVHPYGLRVGVTQDWLAKWYADDKNFSKFLIEDIKIRNYIKEKLYAAGISKIVIERASNRIKIDIHAAKPGMVIGKGGAGIDKLREELEKMTNKTIILNIVEVKTPELSAQLVAENVAAQIEKRISYRRAMKQAIARAMKLGAKGIKIACSGRLAGAEIARTERYHEGVVPLQTLRADIDYGFAEANTTYGKIGVKVWINKGEILPQPKKQVTAEGGN